VVWLPPLLTIASYFLVFDVVFGMRLGQGAPTSRVGTYLIVGMLPWMAFADAVQRGMSSLLDAGSLLHKNPLPPVLFPARAVLASGVVFAPLLLLLVPLYAGSHQFAPGVWALAPLLALQGVLAFCWPTCWPFWRRRCATWCRWWACCCRWGCFCRRCCFRSRCFPRAGAGCCGSTR
jgi:lipopolysaccharide transport system permease protein